MTDRPARVNLNLPPADPPLLRFDAVSVRRAGRLVLDAVDLQLGAAQTIAVLGLNGAGKSTLLALAAGARAPDLGEVRVAGQRAGSAAAAAIGWLPDPVPLYPELSVCEQIAAAAALQGLVGAARQRAVARAIERLDLGALSKRLCGQLSRGMRQRVGVAQAICHDPKLLLLDEPCAGLDPLQQQHLLQLLHALKAEMGIVHVTHLFADIDRHVDRVLILNRGRIALDAPRAELGDISGISAAFMRHGLALEPEAAA